MGDLSTVVHDIASNTLEASWVVRVLDESGELIELKRVKCRNYPHEQKAEFLADTGAAGQKYVDMAGW